LKDLLRTSELSNKNIKSICVDICLTYKHLGNNAQALDYYNKAINLDLNDLRHEIIKNLDIKNILKEFP
jgi:tetratricopeptide (TPR) repeat protein